MTLDYWKENILHVAMIVKVCGMRVAQNIREVSALDVDWLGLVFWPESPRFVKQVSARGGFYPDYSPLATKVAELGGMPEITRRVNKPQRVGVFVDDMPQTIVTRVYNFFLDAVQLHGNEGPVMIENLRRTLEPDIRPVKIIKTIEVGCAEDLRKCEDYGSLVDYFLFHNKCVQKGGSGDQFDWSLLDAYQGKVPFLLSGGIGPDDAQRIKAIHHPQFAGIDINSRFEIEPGLKDVASIKRFLEELRA